MKTLRLAPVLAVLMMHGLTACPETTVPRNFGGKPLKLKTGDWQGTWRIAGDDDYFRFNMKDAAAGHLVIVAADDDKKKDKDDPIEVIVRETGAKENHLAFMIVLSEPAGQRGSLNLITSPEKGVFHSWNMKHDVIEAAVKSGELKGEIKEVKEKAGEKPHHHTSLLPDPANYEKLMDPKFWEWTEPGTIVREPVK